MVDSSEKKRSPDEVIRVMVRVRPPLSREMSVNISSCITVPSPSSLLLVSDKHHVKCSYDRVFSELSDQSDVFTEVKPLLEDVLSGYNGCVFAYGQTSAGKTHTMIGPEGGQMGQTGQGHMREEWGVLPRAAEFLFSSLEESSHTASVSGGSFSYSAKASFLQIYNERIIDLLRVSDSDYVSHRSRGRQEEDLRIREIPGRGGAGPCEVYVTGLSEFRVQTAEDVLRILAVGSHNRATRSTNYNATSSRSHAILQLSFEIEKSEGGQTIIYKSKLSLVDLAGSEKMLAISEGSDSAPAHLKELTSINQSLSSLGNVIAALASKRRSHIPYRDSKLTRLLQDSLGGNTRTILISCVAPTSLHASESISTLQFADRAKCVMVKTKANLVIDDKALLQNAQAEIARLKLLLKQALRKLESVTGNGGGEGDLRLEDGETADEMDRVLKENRQLRKENTALIKELRGIRNGKAWKSRRIQGTPVSRRGGGSSQGGARRKVKPEWSTSLVDDEVYKETAATRKQGRRLERGNVTRQSRTSPVISEGPPHDSGSLPSLDSARRQEQVKTGSRSSHQYRIRNALGYGAAACESPAPTKKQASGPALGSPTKPIEDIRRSYFTINGTDISDEEGSLDVDGDLDLDLQGLRDKLRRAQDSAQMKALEQRLASASRSVNSQLEADEASLQSIQQSRLELERQLEEMRRAQEAEDEQQIQERHKVDELEREQQKQQVSTSPADNGGTENASLPVHKPRSKAEVRNQHPPANLTYSKEDTGRTIEMYVYRYNAWEPIELLDFETSNQLHKCRHPDRTEKWLDLKKKPIRSVPTP